MVTWSVPACIVSRERSVPEMGDHDFLFRRRRTDTNPRWKTMRQCCDIASCGDQDATRTRTGHEKLLRTLRYGPESIAPRMHSAGFAHVRNVRTFQTLKCGCRPRSGPLSDRLLRAIRTSSLARRGVVKRGGAWRGPRHPSGPPEGVISQACRRSHTFVRRTRTSDRPSQPASLLWLMSENMVHE